MEISQQKLEKFIKKLFDVIKPNGVSDIEFDLSPTNLDNEYYMGINYIVPNDSNILKMNKSELHYLRNDWGYEIKKTIKDYFNVDIIINSTAISSELFHNKIR